MRRVKNAWQREAKDNVEKNWVEREIWQKNRSYSLKSVWTSNKLAFTPKMAKKHKIIYTYYIPVLGI